MMLVFDRTPSETDTADRRAPPKTSQHWVYQTLAAAAVAAAMYPNTPRALLPAHDSCRQCSAHALGRLATS